MKENKKAAKDHQTFYPNPFNLFYFCTCKLLKDHILCNFDSITTYKNCVDAFPWDQLCIYMIISVGHEFSSMVMI